MGAPDALAAYGTQLKLGDGAGPPENFTTIAKVRDITGPGISLATEDVTAHDSPGAWREKIATLLDAGQVTFDIVYKPVGATHGNVTGLLRDIRSRIARSFQAVFPDSGSTTWEFTAYVTQFQPTAPVPGALTAAVTLEITGQPTLA